MWKLKWNTTINYLIYAIPHKKDPEAVAAKRVLLYVAECLIADMNVKPVLRTGGNMDLQLSG